MIALKFDSAIKSSINVVKRGCEWEVGGRLLPIDYHLSICLALFIVWSFCCNNNINSFIILSYNQIRFQGHYDGI